MERATRVMRRSPRRHTDPAVAATVVAAPTPFTMAAGAEQYGVPGWLP